MDDTLIPELDTAFVFQRRPVNVPADLRPGWRIGVILLLLRNCCRQNRTRFTRLHVLNWGVRTRENRDALAAAVTGSVPFDTLLVRIEPSLNRAVDYAIGEGLVRRISGDQLELTDSGVRLADEIAGSEDLYGPEKAFMERIGKRVTEKLVAELFG